MATTPATLAALKWLARTGTDGEFSGGSLVEYYREKSDSIHPTTDRRHGWRRTGGRVLKRAADDGLVESTRRSWGTPQYRFTQAGKDAVRDA